MAATERGERAAALRVPLRSPRRARRHHGGTRPRSALRFGGAAVGDGDLARRHRGARAARSPADGRSHGRRRHAGLGRGARDQQPARLRDGEPRAPARRAGAARRPARPRRPKMSPTRSSPRSTTRAKAPSACGSSCATCACSPAATPAERGPVDLGGVLQAAERMAGNMVKARARVVQEHAPLPPVDGNATRLCQVFVNILSTRRRRSPAAHPEDNEVRVRAAARRRPGRRRGARHRRRHPRRRARPHLRSLLQHQGHRRRHRPRPVGVPRHRDVVRRRASASTTAERAAAPSCASRCPL